jgi:hypothetical protein
MATPPWLSRELAFLGLGGAPRVRSFVLWQVSGRRVDGTEETARALLPQLARPQVGLDGARWSTMSRSLLASEPLRSGMADWICRMSKRKKTPLAEFDLRAEGQRFGPYQCVVSSDSQSDP